MRSIARPARVSGSRWWKKVWKHRAMYLMLALPVLLLVLFHYVPMYGVQIAFRNYQPSRSIAESPWVGLRYVAKFMENYKFWSIMRNTLLIGLYGIAVAPCALILAVLLNYVGSAAFKKTVQTVSYLPHFISTVVMCSLILQFFDANSGVVNAIAALFGKARVNYMGRSQYFYHIYIWTSVWQDVGYASIIYIAALSGISRDQHDAAIVDGATILRRIWHIDIPGVMPTFSVLIIMRCGQLLNVGYEKVYLLQNSLNLEVSEVIATYVYKQGLTSTLPQYSYSTAIGLFVAVINLIVLLVVNRVARAVSENSLW